MSELNSKYEELTAGQPGISKDLANEHQEVLTNWKKLEEEATDRSKKLEESFK